MEWNEFCEKIKSLFGNNLMERLSMVFDDSKISYSINSKSFEFTFDEFTHFVDNTSSYTFESTFLYNNNLYEAIILDRMLLSTRKLIDTNFRDDNKGITYSFNLISDRMIWNIILNWDFTNRTPAFIAPFRYSEEKHLSVENLDLFSVVRSLIREPISIVLQSDNPIKIEQLSDYAQSYLFNYTYNNDVVLKTIDDLSELFPQRNRLGRRRSSNTISPPYLSYKKELIDQYYMALMSDDPFIKYIGFYHIMEFFYDDVYKEDMLKNVQDILKHPKFSPYKEKDVIKIIELIKNKTRQNTEEFQGSELEALELTLKKYVELNELIDEINEISRLSLDYYSTSEVDFSKGDKVDLRNNTDTKVYKKLAARIYKTRNSLVHSKSNDLRTKERGVYSPFADRKTLLKEIPLMRAISEIIIIRSASSFQ